MSKHYYSATQCASSLETFMGLANKRPGVRQPTYSQLELMNDHVGQIIAMLRDPAQAAAIERAIAGFRGAT